MHETRALIFGKLHPKQPLDVLNELLYKKEPAVRSAQVRAGLKLCVHSRQQRPSPNRATRRRTAIIRHPRNIKGRRAAACSTMAGTPSRRRRSSARPSTSCRATCPRSAPCGSSIIQGGPREQRPQELLCSPRRTRPSPNQFLWDHQVDVAHRAVVIRDEDGKCGVVHRRHARISRPPRDV